MSPEDVLAWEPIPLDLYKVPLPKAIHSSWVFILRANTVSGAERHPNSHQRMMSYRGTGDPDGLFAPALTATVLGGHILCSHEDKLLRS
jgi:hypothetical protein